MLFSEVDVMDEIRKVVNEDIQNYDYSLDFLDVTPVSYTHLTLPTICSV